MRVLVILQALLSSALLQSAASAFATPPVFGLLKHSKAPIGPLFDKAQMADSSLDIHNLRPLIDNLAADNFEKSLELIEPLLVNECTGQECEDYLGQLQAKCKEIGLSLPAGFAPSHH